MKGIELSERYFLQYGKPMLEEQFADLLPLVSVGLFGKGSECFGFDDETSHDHDFEPGFCVMLPDENVVDRKRAFALERAYAKLHKEFEGYVRAPLSPVGGNRHGVFRTSEWLEEAIGNPTGELSLREWLGIEEFRLAEVVNGKMFHDGGNFGKIRASLARYPRDVRLKKLAGRLLAAAQAGQYNFARCLAHGEKAAAQLAVFEFCKHAVAAAFLLNDVYAPYYKWVFRALKNLPKLSKIAAPLEFLLTTDNERDNAEKKIGAIELVCADLVDELKKQELTKATCGDLGKHAYSVNDGVADANLRNLHVLFAI